MGIYSANNAKYGTHNLVGQQIGKGKLVLDVGCNKGYLKQFAPENTYHGIDHSKAAIQIAKQNGYVRTTCLDLNIYEQFASDSRYDVIVFADILEHLVCPEKVLNFFVQEYLNEKGRVIVSLPNVAHVSVRFQLMLGNFEYVDNGILDRTHLHLYTVKTARALMKSAGLHIIREIYSSNNFGGLIKTFPFLGGLLGYNFIFVCRKES